MVFSAFFNCIEARTFEGSSLTCGRGSKTSLNLDLSCASCFKSVSLAVKISILSRIAPATLKFSVIVPDQVF